MKFKNEVDVELLRQYASGLDLEHRYSDRLIEDSDVSVVIFKNSVTFRKGSSSVKTIEDFPKGFKTSGSVTQYKNSNTKIDRVLGAALYFLKYHPERVKTESDKTEAVETEQVVQTQAALQKLIDEYGSVRLKVGDEFYEVDSFKQVSGRPKADMTFNFKNKSVIFVSHKKGSRAGDFQQYGGVADLGIKNESDMKKYPAMEEFRLEVRQIFQAMGQVVNQQDRYDFNAFKKGGNLAKLINDENVAHTVMFGRDYHTKNPGLDNCSILIDGDIIFAPIKGLGANCFELKGSYHEQVNPCLLRNPPKFRADPDDIYAPVMFYMKSESQGLNQGGFMNSRFVVWPNNKTVRLYTKKFGELKSAVDRKDTNKLTQLSKELLKESV